MYIDLLFGLKATTAEFEYMYNYTHLIYFFVIMTISIFVSMWYFRRNEQKQKRFLIVMLVLMIFFELGRVTFNYFYLDANNLEINLINIIDLSLFNLAIWISIPILIIVLIRGKDAKGDQTLLTFIFSVTSVFCLFDLIYPQGLYTGFAIIHFSNVIFLAQHTVIFTLVLFLGSTDWLRNVFEDIWKALFNLFLIAAICAIIYFVSDASIDLAFFNGFPIFAMIGLDIEIWLQLIILAVFFFCCQVLIYFGWGLYRKIKTGTWRRLKN